MGEQAGAHFLEAFLLVGGELFGSLLLLGRLTLAVLSLSILGLALLAASAADNINDGNDDWTALGLFKQVMGDVVLELDFKAVEVDALKALLDGALEFDAQAVHDLFVVAHVDEAAADDVGAGHQVAGALQISTKSPAT